MIIINQPYIYSYNDKTRVEALVENQRNNTEKKIWYEVEEKYGDFLCYELADAFLLAILPIATQTEQDIIVHGNVSPKLLAQTKTTHIPLYAQFLQKNEIKIVSDESRYVPFDGKAVATGGSLGVDSLSTVYQHIGIDCPEEERLSHLTLFNSSQIGNIEGEALYQSFEKSCKKTISFAEEIGLDFVGINSNISSLINENGLLSTQVFHFFTISCVLALQKFFKTYYYSSGVAAKHTRMAHDDMAYFESLFVSGLGNENVEIVLSDQNKSRVEKTKLICENALTPKYLDVCWAEQAYLNEGGRKYYLEGKKKRNCGWCEKCLRTLFTIDLLGEIDKFTDAFDLDKYYQYKKDYSIRVVANENYNEFYKEIIELMKEKGVKPPLIGYILKIFNVKDSKVVLRLWQSYNSVKRACLNRKCN